MKKRLGDETHDTAVDGPDEHAGHPSTEDFRFEEDRHTGVYVCRQVAEGAPILYVTHDLDGDWQFLCGETHGESEVPELWCLEQVVARDPSLNELAGLCRNNRAERSTPSASWAVTDESEEFIARCVEEHGWAVQIIEEDDGQPGFAYTIGLHANYGHPELIMIGPRAEVMHTVLNSCGERVKGGQKLPVGARVADVLDDYDVMFREVRTPSSFEEHVGYALWFYQGKPFRLLQLVWPDKENRFPGEAEVAEWLEAAQPLLP